MHLMTPFVMSVGICNVNDSVPYLRQLFKNKADKLVSIQNNNHSTTLAAYSPLEYVNDLDDSEESNKVRDQIKSAAMEYATECGYAADKYEPVVVGFWLNEMHSSGKHPIHSHHGLTFSGCIYIDMPLNTSGLRIHSYRARFDYSAMAINNQTVYNASLWEFNPREGQLYLWESWIQHEVIPAEYEGVRRSAAFDVVMKRKI